MPLIQKDWSKLKEILAKSDPKVIKDKKIGIDKTLVISVQDLRYDSSIPILEEEDLEKWIELRESGQLFSRESDEDSDADRNNLNDKSDQEQPESHQNNQEQEAPLEQENENYQQNPDFQQDPDSLILNDDEQEQNGEENKLTDELVINEPEDDEFAKFKDDDDDIEETQMSRNLKKIRSNLIVSKPQENLPKKKTTPKKSPVKKSNVIIQNNKSNNTSPSKKSPAKKDNTIHLEVEPPTPKEPAKPNWPETNQYIQQNRLEVAYRDLHHFKDHINSDELARPLLLELVKKCIQEDESRLLIDSLKLIYDLGIYTDEIEFWSELVLRLKRKLIAYDNVKNLKFKTKADPNQVHDNYKYAMLNFSEHAKRINQTFKLPLQAIYFLIDPLKVLEPESLNIKPKIEPQKMEQENNPEQNSQNINFTNSETNSHQVLNQSLQNNLQTNGNQHVNYHHLNNNSGYQSNNSYQNNDTRKVILIQNKFGKDSFKILMKPKNNLSESPTSSSLDTTQNGNVFRRRL